VALYSPGYFNKAWPLRERESFLRQFQETAAGDAERRVVPVLWVPLPPWDHPDERAAALGLAAGVAEYAENGLRALCRLAMYREQYRTVLTSLAHRIVQTARTAAPRTSRPAAIDSVDVELAEPTDMSFAVTVLAPTRGDLPAGRSPSAYGVIPRSWQPYAETQQFPIAEYAVNVAERLGLQARVVDWDADWHVLEESPAVVLIDPWVAETPGGADKLAALPGRLPEWGTALLVANRRDPQYVKRGADLIAAVAARLRSAGARHVRRILDVDQLGTVMPVLINDSCRRYLKNAPVFLPKGPHPALPRLPGGEEAHG
jgi:FxsC-like protein